MSLGLILFKMELLILFQLMLLAEILMWTGLLVRTLEILILLIPGLQFLINPLMLHLSILLKMMGVLILKVLSVLFLPLGWHLRLLLAQFPKVHLLLFRTI